MKEKPAAQQPEGITNAPSAEQARIEKEWHTRLSEAIKEPMDEVGKIDKDIMSLEGEEFDKAHERRNQQLEQCVDILQSFLKEATGWHDENGIALCREFINMNLQMLADIKRTPDLIKQTRSVIQESKAAETAYENAVKKAADAEKAFHESEQRLDQLTFELLKTIYEEALEQKTDPIFALQYFAHSSNGEYVWETDVEPYIGMIESSINNKTSS